MMRLGREGIRSRGILIDLARLERVGVVVWNHSDKMAAFVSGFSTGSARVVRSTVCKNASSVSMMAKSKAMPFMEAPPALDGSMAGDVGFDPLGFTRAFDVKWMREAELKHGRVAMLAVLGFIATGAGFHLPDPVFSGTKPLDVLSGLAESRPLALIQIVAAITWIELVAGKQDPSKDPGDVGSFGDNFKPADPEEYAALQLKELKNGRLAMLASMGLIVQELITGENIVDQLSKGIF